MDASNVHELIRPFDPLSHDADTETVGEIENGLDDCP